MADVEALLSETFAGVKAEGFLHACDLDSGAEVRYRADSLGHPASSGKIAILVAVMRSVASGEHALDEPILIPAAKGAPFQLMGDLGHGGTAKRQPDARTPGPSGLSIMKHQAELSLRDVALSMIYVSDNHATDILLGLVPPARVTATMRELGLQQTTIETTIAEMYDRLLARLANVSDEAEALRLVREEFEGWPATAPWRTTPEEMTRLLAMIWRDEAAPPELCAEMREILLSQLFQHRLATGSSEEVKIGAKTGTLALSASAAEPTTGIRNECGVVQYPDGRRYAVAIFTRSENFNARDPDADRAIGTAARIVIDHLRAGVETTVSSG